MLVKYLLALPLLFVLAFCAQLEEVKAKLQEFAKRQLAQIEALGVRLSPRMHPIQAFFMHAFTQEEDPQTVSLLLKHLPEQYSIQYLEEQELDPGFSHQFWYKFADDFLASLCHPDGTLPAQILGDLIIRRSYPLFPKFLDYFLRYCDLNPISREFRIQYQISGIFAKFSREQFIEFLTNSDDYQNPKVCFQDLLRRYVASGTFTRLELRYCCLFLVRAGLQNIKNLLRTGTLYFPPRKGSHIIRDLAFALYKKIRTVSPAEAKAMVKSIWPELYKTLPPNSRNFFSMLKGCVKAEWSGLAPPEF